MSKKKWLHTPGPWLTSSYGFQVLNKDETVVICTLPAYGNEVLQMANACLIATSPKLLQVCKAVFEWSQKEDAEVGGGFDYFADVLVPMLEEAITEAGGNVS